MAQQAPQLNEPPGSRFRFNAIQPLDRLRSLLPTPLSKPADVEIDTSPIPQTNIERRRASSFIASLDHDATLPEKISAQQEHGVAVSDTAAREETVLYLAYGSNLASKTFRGMRGIKPLSQICVFVPELQLTFDLPGFPYAEPCFAGTHYRNYSQSAGTDYEADDDFDGVNGESWSEKASLLGRTRDVEIASNTHKGRWPKPLIGVVYEVTLADYAKIIATEGGGRGYRDGVIDCYPFPQNYDPSDPVPDHPNTIPFKAHTLLSPAADSARFRLQSQKSGLVVPSSGLRLSWWHTICLHLRSDPDYAQPSARYLGLIKAGGAEHNLPLSYQKYLAQVKTYHITTTRQKVGKLIFLGLWAPLILLTLALSRMFAGPDGRSPPWLVALANVVVSAMWNSYDGFFVTVFGDGERTIDDTPA